MPLKNTWSKKAVLLPDGLIPRGWEKDPPPYPMIQRQDALKIVARGVNTLRSPERAVVLVTHYQRLLDHIVPDRVHVLAKGRIVRSGDRSLALELEKRGYDWLTQDAA